ncbi:hypothetical protein Ctaglu_14080 [Clostridium tagluense]|uniref:Uncharacterized protein n=1 Tax=Clostridium tagluense TaxID=360422 RepID=A0A401UJV1_9CLOT|nr:hypothetical protein Ctaglu_14080 [Clostridium tagluense]
MWFKSTAAPATVIEDEPFITTRKGKGKGRVNQEPGDLPKSVILNFRRERTCRN